MDNNREAGYAAFFVKLTTISSVFGASPLGVQWTLTVRGQKAELLKSSIRST